MIDKSPVNSRKSDVRSHLAGDAWIVPISFQAREGFGGQKLLFRIRPA